MRVLTSTRLDDDEDSDRTSRAGDSAVTAASRLRVVMHTRVVTGVGGGPDKTILNSPRFLEPFGFRTICAYMHPPGDLGMHEIRQRAERAGAQLRGIVDRGPFDWRVARELLRLCRRERVAIWHGHDYKSNALGLLLRPFWPMRLVTTVHGWGVTGGRRALYYAIDRGCMRFYDRVICVSEDLLEECCAAGVPRNRCRLVHNAIDTRQFARREEREDTKRRMGLSPGRLLVGAVGRLSNEKGFDRLIAAFDRLLSDGVDAELHIVGEGPERSQLERLIAECGCQDRIRLAGHQSNVIDWFQAMDVFALSSLREGLPNVVLEAMAMGVPVIATRIAGVPRIVEDGINGLLVEPDDVDGIHRSLRTLLVDSAMRERLGRAGRQTVEADYSFDVRMHKIRELYHELLGDVVCGGSSPGEPETAQS